MEREKNRVMERPRVVRRHGRAAAAGAVVAAGALTVAVAPPAAAGGSWQVSVSPTTVAPGGKVTLSSSGCKVPTVTADSAVFDTTELNEGHSATAHVFPDAKPGAEYEVTFTCKGKTKTVPLMISDRGGHHPTHHPTHPPHRGVKAGEGGTWDSFSPGQLALGGLLVVGALTFAVRKARGNDG
ncbi:hypothetical protein [Streptomyces sp. NPDC002851]